MHSSHPNDTGSKSAAARLCTYWQSTHWQPFHLSCGDKENEEEEKEGGGAEEEEKETELEEASKWRPCLASGAQAQYIVPVGGPVMIGAPAVVATGSITMPGGIW